MSISFDHSYIKSTGLCDLKTLYYQTGQTSKRAARCRVCINIVRKIQSICCVKHT